MRGDDLPPDPEDDGRDRDQPRAPSDPKPPKWTALLLRADDWPDVETPTKFLVPALQLAPGRAAAFNGPGGIGKTLVAQTIAAALLGGLGALDGLVSAGRKRRVLHVDGDQGVATTRRRYRRICAGLGVTERPLILGLAALVDDGFDLTSARDWTLLLRGFDLAIVDSLSVVVAIAGLDENLSQDVRKILSGLLAASESTGCAVVLITHTGHDDADGVKKKRPRGSSAIIQGLGAIWTFVGDPARGSTRIVTLQRESESSDDCEPLTSWRYTIGTDPSRATPGMLDAYGGVIAALVVRRAAGGAGTDEADRDNAIKGKILDTLAREKEHTNVDELLKSAKAGNLATARPVFAALKGKGIVTKHEGKFRLASEVQ
ncbi:MAG: AAA family ATPase [Polyangiales bacterium]